MGLVVVGGMHGAEPLLSSSVPEIYMQIKRRRINTGVVYALGGGLEALPQNTSSNRHCLVAGQTPNLG